MLKLNVGISIANQTIEDEMAKIRLAKKYGIDYVSVISIYEPMIKKLWEALADEPLDGVRLCSVPLYESCIFREPLLDTMQRHYDYGVRTFTVHITKRELFERARASNFIVNSRGGQFLWDIFEEGRENPQLVQWEQILRFIHDHDCELMLGTSLRPGAVEKDAMTALKAATIQELYDACHLYDQAAKYGIPTQIECFGHTAYSELSTYRSILEQRPICTMGPLLTDSVNGYDELNAIVGYAYASQALNIQTACMLSRKEHISLPSVEDVEDECQKWRVAQQVVGVALGTDQRAAHQEAEVLAVKGRQRKQCSAHVNIFGKIEMPEVCNVCGTDADGNDRCPLRRMTKN